MPQRSGLIQTSKNMGQLLIELAALLNEIWPYPKRRRLALGLVIVLVSLGVYLLWADHGQATP